MFVNLRFRLRARSQVVCLSVEGEVQVHVDVGVFLIAHPADGRAVEGGTRADVGLQAGQGIWLLCGNAELRDFEGHQLQRLFVAAVWQRRPAEERGGTLERQRNANCSFLHVDSHILPC